MPGLGKPCLIDECTGLAGIPGAGRGWCSKHYQRWQRHGDPLVKTKRFRKMCDIRDCGLPAVGRGWCTKHWTRWERYGDPAYRVPGEIVDGRRICAACQEDLAVDRFYQRADGRVDAWCRPCTARNAARRREADPSLNRKVEKFPMTCAACGADFMGDRKNTLSCSAPCAEEMKRRTGWVYRGRRRARLAAATDGTVETADVFALFGWTCHLCHDEIDPAVKHPDPMSASVDHVIPLARGGSHSVQNVRPAHLSCNLRKGARVTVA